MLEDSQDFWFPSTALINRSVLQHLGLRVTVQRCISHPNDSPGIHALHNHSPGWQPPDNLMWFGRPEISGLNFATPAHRDVIENWFAEAHGATHSEPPYPAWTRAAWWNEATVWITDTARRAGTDVLGLPDQIKSWSVSCLLRVPTTDGALFLKAAPPLFAQEARLTQHLAAMFPTLLPHVVAINADRSWLLMREFSGRSLQESRVVAEWENAIRAFARIQIACIGWIDEFIACGCARRGLYTLTEAGGSFLSELADPGMQQLYGVTELEAQELIARIPIVLSLCDDLSSCNVPDTLIHGDLHGGNIMLTNHDNGISPLFFDWSDGAVAHPFFDLLPLFQVDWMREDASVSARISEAYLEVWTEAMPDLRIQEAFTLSQQIAPFYHAISYRNIVRTAAPASKWELSRGVGRQLRLMLR